MEGKRDPERARLLLLRAGAAALAAAAIASAWSLLAAQSPSSPLHVGPLREPVESLALAAWLAGIGEIALAAVISRLEPDPARALGLAATVAAGVAIMLCGFCLGAVLGTHGNQVIKAYPRTLVVLLVKVCGYLALLAGLVSLARAAFGKRRGGG